MSKSVLSATKSIVFFLPDFRTRSLGWAAKAMGMPRLLSMCRQKLILPFYHAVSDEQLPHIAPLYRHKTVKEFEQDLDYLLRYLQPVDLEAVLAHASHKKHLTKPSFHLSFDDGLKEIATIISPVLERKGIPATVFVNSAFVDNKELFFRYKVALLFQKLEKQSNQKLPVFPFAKKIISREEWQGWLLRLKYERAGLLEPLAKLLEVDFSEFLAVQKPYLTLPQLHALTEKGFSIGAHSIDHPEYQFITEAEQIRQTTVSMAWVKQHFAPSVAAFSFPFTDHRVQKSFFTALLHEKNAPTLLFGTGRLNVEQNPMHLQRLPMEEAAPATNILPSALLVAILKQCTGHSFVSRA